MYSRNDTELGEPDLECYFCSEEVKCKPDCEFYRAWQDVMDSENIYTNVVVGDGKEAYQYKLLPPNVCYIAASNGLVVILWKDKNDPSTTHSHYFNNRNRQGQFITNLKGNTLP